jgi:hypothetical protein
MGAPEGVDLSIVIVNHNSKEFLGQLLPSLYETPCEVTFEVWVVDNNSTDGTLEMVAHRFPQVQLIANEVNRGFAAANNQALQKSRGRYILLLNPDTVLKPRALDIMVCFLDNHREVGAVGPKLLNLDGTVQLSSKFFPTPKVAILKTLGVDRVFPEQPTLKKHFLSPEAREEAQEVESLQASCLMVRREMVDEVGPLDERFFMYCEDIDWCRRMREKGWKLYFLPEAQALHYRGGSTNKDSYRMIIVYHQSLYRFYEKYYAPDTFWLLNYAFYGGLLLRLALKFLVNLFRREKRAR